VSDTITICSFNIQIFGVSKMSKPEVVDILVDIVSQADISAIQEVRSSSEEPVLQFMERLPLRYDYVLGPREGRSSSKEQYWVIYDTSKLELIAIDTWSDPQDIYERNPLGVFFRTKDGFDFIIIDNHIQPSGALAEITALPEVIRYYREFWQETDILVVGDFNADGSYYNEALLESTFPPDEYVIIIGNDVDTTVAASANTYDRFIITSTAIEDYTGNSGVIRFDERYDFSSLSIEPRNVSDHYPIWAEFRVNADTD
jgi:endonuclease/exonuclease/phosphatase family metal-dependent hydrolase